RAAEFNEREIALRALALVWTISERGAMKEALSGGRRSRLCIGAEEGMSGARGGGAFRLKQRGDEEGMPFKFHDPGLALRIHARHFHLARCEQGLIARIQTEAAVILLHHFLFAIDAADS